MLNLAASFDLDLVNDYVGAIIEEFIAKGSNVILGPGMNLARVPTNGRNFEYGAGEDPHLGSEIMKAYVKKAQSMGVIATAKHFVNNEQEINRTTVSSNLDERTAWELYYQPFMASVEAGVLAVMCSYNKIGDTWACENDHTLNQVLKGKMGFKGWVMSDWDATHSTQKAALAGLDQEMPFNPYFGDALKAAVQNAEVPQQRVDDMVYRILYSMFAIGLFDKPQTGNFTANVTSDAHYAVARGVAAASTILLKNDRQVLPLDTKTITTIAVLGDAGDLAPVVGGQGSGQVPVAHIVSPLEGIKAHLADTNIQVVYAPSTPIEQAVAIAQSADVALVFSGVTSCEGIDRANLSLPNADNQLIKAVAAVNPRTAVVVTSPGSILLPWSNSVPAIVAALLPGQQFGHAIADVLFGDVNPSARLPITLPNVDNEVNFTQSQYPGINNEANYTEGLLIGYRWYDAANVAPKFAFGHGLSYTTFHYGKIVAFPFKNAQKLTNIAVVTKITNVGSVAGSEVAQLYLSYPDVAREPPKQLRGFQKVFLQPGQSAEVRFELTTQHISIWDVEIHDWNIIPGEYKIMVGASSRDIRLVGTFQVSGRKHIHSVRF